MTSEQQKRWVDEVIHKFDEAYRPQPREPSVSRGPRGDSKVHAYTPEIVSFGIYNRPLRVPLLPREEDKIHAVSEMVGSINKDREWLINNVLKSVTEIKLFYEDFPRHLSDEVIAWMFTMDACFIIQFLDRNCRPNLFSLGVTKDIFKLENQIPLTFLLRILQLEHDNHDPENGEARQPIPWLAEKLCGLDFFKTTPFPLNSTRADVEIHLTDACHLLDVLRRTIKRFLSDDSGNEPSEDRNKYIISSAEDLHKNGIRFKRSVAGKVGFQYGWFRSTLVIPQIYLGEDIEPIVQNLMAFEDSLSGEEATISQFMVLMDCLIESKKDVALLRNAEIIKTRIGSNNDIAVKFNNLCKGFGDNCSIYEDVARRVEDHGKNPVNGWINGFKEEYRTKPWYIVSVVAATVLLVLTAMQTYYAHKQTY